MSTTKKTVAITSVYANPLHPGHIECFELSKQHADELYVIVNNDHQAKLKRGVESFQDEQFRVNVVRALKMVDGVFLSIDTDASVCASLDQLITELKARPDVGEIIFTKGGDRFAHEIPEREILASHGVRIVDGLGAKTHNSSAYVPKLANLADAAKVTAALDKLPDSVKEIDYLEVGVRPWGVYYVMEDKPQYKVKKIIVNPSGRLSLQSHKHRSEHWVVVSGVAHVEVRAPHHPSHIGHQLIEPNQGCYIPKGHIHRLSNPNSEPLVMIEVQCGEYTGEDDIERFEDDYDRVPATNTEATA